MGACCGGPEVFLRAALGFVRGLGCAAAAAQDLPPAASPRRFRNQPGLAPPIVGLLVLTLAGCASGPAFVAADYAKCQELGFQQGSREYAICLSEVEKRRTSLAAAPDSITE